jgi:multidrug resistance efflux pump
MRYFLLLLLPAFLPACTSGDDKTVPGPAIVADSSAALEIREVMGIAIIEPAGRITSLASESKGIVKDIRVRIGQPLKTGQIILLLDATVENAQLRQANSKLEAQQNAIQAATENLRLLQVQLDKAKADLVRDEALFNGKALTQKELDNSRYQVSNVQQQIQGQQAVIRQQQARIKELQADIDYYQTLVSQKNVSAPANGTLLSLDAKVGEFLDANTAIGDFAPEGPVIALTEIDELFAGRIQTGQKAYIRLQGKTDTLSTGTVIMTSPYLRKKSLFSDKPDDLEDRRVREVRVQLDRPDAVLLGARVECVVAVGG